MYKLMNLSKQDHRENEGTLLLDLKMIQINANPYCQALSKFVY
jgi:hypothetical protein